MVPRRSISFDRRKTSTSWVHKSLSKRGLPKLREFLSQNLEDPPWKVVFVGTKVDWSRALQRLMRTGYTIYIVGEIR